jgi:hypothetical protein
MSDGTLHFEWIRAFLLSKYDHFASSTSPSNQLTTSLYHLISRFRTLISCPGAKQFVNHTMYSLAISAMDPNFSFADSSLDAVYRHLAKHVPRFPVALSDLTQPQLTRSHEQLARATLAFYLTTRIKPSSICQFCRGNDLSSYTSAFLDWAKRNCSVDLNFVQGFGTGQFAAAILWKIRPELIRLNRVSFGRNLLRREVQGNWRELEASLEVIQIRAPTLNECQDELCLLCFAADLYLAANSLRPIGAVSGVEFIDSTLSQIERLAVSTKAAQTHDNFVRIRSTREKPVRQIEFDDVADCQKACRIHKKLPKPPDLNTEVEQAKRKRKQQDHRELNTFDIVDIRGEEILAPHEAAKPERVPQRPKPEERAKSDAAKRPRKKRKKKGQDDEFSGAADRKELLDTVSSFLQLDKEGLGHPDDPLPSRERSELLSAVNLFLRTEREKLRSHKPPPHQVPPPRPLPEIPSHAVSPPRSPPKTPLHPVSPPRPRRETPPHPASPQPEPFSPPASEQVEPGSLAPDADPFDIPVTAKTSDQPGQPDPFASDDGEETPALPPQANSLSLSDNPSPTPQQSGPPPVLAAHSSSDSVIPYRLIEQPGDSSGSFEFEVQSPHSSKRALANTADTADTEDFPGDSSSGGLVATGKISEIVPFDIDSLDRRAKKEEPPRVSFSLTSSAPAQLSVIEEPVSETPVEERIRQYARSHQRLSLSMTNRTSERFKIYLADVAAAPPGKYVRLTEDEETVVWCVVDRIKSAVRREVFQLVARELGVSKRSQVVGKIAGNILAFFQSEERR